MTDHVRDRVLPVRYCGEPVTHPDAVKLGCFKGYEGLYQERSAGRAQGVLVGQLPALEERGVLGQPRDEGEVGASVVGARELLSPRRSQEEGRRLTGPYPVAKQPVYMKVELLGEHLLDEVVFDLIGRAPLDLGEDVHLRGRELVQGSAQGHLAQGVEVDDGPPP